MTDPVEKALMMDSIEELGVSRRDIHPALPQQECYRTVPADVCAESPNRVGGAHGGADQHGARREVLAALADRYRSATRRMKGRMLDEQLATT